MQTVKEKDISTLFGCFLINIAATDRANETMMPEITPAAAEDPGVITRQTKRRDATHNDKKVNKTVRKLFVRIFTILHLSCKCKWHVFNCRLKYIIHTVKKTSAVLFFRNALQDFAILHKNRCCGCCIITDEKNCKGKNIVVYCKKEWGECNKKCAFCTILYIIITKKDFCSGGGIFMRSKTKKLKMLSAVIAVLMILPIVSFCAFAVGATGSGACGQNVNWELDENGVLTISGTGPMADFFTEEYPDGSPWNVAGLTEQIKKVVVEDGVTSIGSSAFYQCSELTEVSLPEGLTEIRELAFTDCKKLEKINFPSTLKAIRCGAFGVCLALEDIDLPSGLETIEYFGFYECKGLKNVVIPDSVTELGYETFRLCENLESVNVPRGVTEVTQSLFADCPSLTTVKLHDGITLINNMAFSKCTKFTEFTIPAGVEEIAGNAFNLCTAIKEFKVDPKNKFFSAEDGILYNKDKTALKCYPLGKTETKFTLPANVKSISSSAFSDCTQLTEIEFPANGKLESIEIAAFWNCSGLTSVVLPEGLKSIGSSAFGYCPNLVSLNIPDSVELLGTNVICKTPLYDSLSAADPDTVYLDGWALALKDDASVEELTLKDGTRGIATEFLPYDYALKKLSLPASLVYFDYDFFEFSGGIDEIVVDKDNPVLAATDGMLYDKKSGVLIKYCVSRPDKEITVPYGVSEIYDDAFKEAKNLEKVVFPSTLKSIGYDAFEHCEKLTKADLPEGLEIIGDYAFYHCYLLADVKIPESVKRIGVHAFKYSAYLDEPKNKVDGVIKNNGWLLVVDKTLDSSYVVDSDVKGIAGRAFSYSDQTALESLTLPSGLIYIGKYNFRSADALKDVYFLENEDVWNNNVVVENRNDSLREAQKHFTNWIYEIEIDGATLDFNVGDEPLFTASVQEGKGYSLEYESWTAEKTGWTSSDSHNAHYTESADGCTPLNEFVIGTQYSYNLSLKAADGYAFSDEVVLKINGKEIELSDKNRANIQNDSAVFDSVIKMSVECKSHISSEGNIATCHEQAVCDICGESYGAPNPNVHCCIEHFEEKAATKDATGNIEYWYCSGCDKYFSDEALTKEIGKSDIVTPKLSADGNGKVPTDGKNPSSGKVPSTEKRPTNGKTPKTGDDSLAAFWIVMTAVSGMGLASVAVYKKRRLTAK